MLPFCLALAALQDSAAPVSEPLNALGLTLMVVSVSSVTILMVWCFYRVLTAPAEPPKPVEEFRSA